MLHMDVHGWNYIMEKSYVMWYYIIFLAFAFKVMFLYIFGVKCILQ